MSDRASRLVFLFIVCVAVVLPASAWAQGPTSGSVNGTITDNTGAMLPGVTVTATGPALMGAQTSVSNEHGQYRLPALPPGTYRLAYELAGFTTVIRDGIVVSIGFTATINVQLALAGLQESVTVTGESPVVDIQNTNVQNNFNAQLLANLPNARDIWSLLAVAPGTMVTRFDVGGSTAGTQTGYTAYGMSGQVRVSIDGVNSTEGTGGTGYFDYGAFEEVQIGTDSNDASMPTPGVQLNAVLKSGGNDFKTEFYLDYENQDLQGKNVDDRLRRLGVGEGTRITKYYDANLQVGGPFKRDTFWYFVSTRAQDIGIKVTGYPVERPGDFEFMTGLYHITYKLTYQLGSNNRFSHYVQLRRKLQPRRGASSTLYADAVYKQDSISTYGNAEWNRIVSPRFFFNARMSTWGYNWIDYAYGADIVLGENLVNRRSEVSTGNVEGSAYADQTYRRRWQFDWSGTLYEDDFLGGSHALRMGYLTEWEVLHYEANGYKEGFQMSFNSPAGSPDFTRPYRVTLYNTPSDSENSLWHHGAYVQDQINVGRKLTLNAGVRWDSYEVYYPEQTVDEHPFRNFFYAGTALPNGYSIPSSFPTFTVPARRDIVRYGAAFGPRFGVAYDLQGNGKTVLKASWGRYWHNPGPRDDINPIQETSYTFNWSDLNSDRFFTLNELGTLVSSSGGVSNSVDPKLAQPHTDDMSVFVEREIVPAVSGRVGYVYKRQQNLYQNIELNRVASLYTGTATGYDSGPDGVRGNADDVGTVTVFDIPSPVTILPSRTMLSTPEDNDLDYRSIDVTINKRMTGRWSLVASGVYTWNHQTLNGHPQNPNQALYNEYRTTTWAFKAFGTYRAPWDIVISPIVRHQSGDPLRRIVQVTGLRSGTFNYTAEGFDKYREDNVTIFDARLEKEFRVGGGRKVGVFFDAFNITNSNAAQSQDNVTGRRTVVVDGQLVEYQRFMRPTVVIGPRIFRFGLKLDF